MERRPVLLIIEDEHRLRRLVSDFLRGAGFEVAEGEDGPDGVDRFMLARPFDLVLLDLNLPGYGGVEVCRRIRRLEPAQPVLVTSAVVFAEADEAFRQMGIDQFLSKPYRPDILLDRVRALVAATVEVIPEHHTPRSRALDRGPARLASERQVR